MLVSEARCCTPTMALTRLTLCRPAAATTAPPFLHPLTECCSCAGVPFHRAITAARGAAVEHYQEEREWGHEQGAYQSLFLLSCDVRTEGGWALLGLGRGSLSAGGRARIPSISPTADAPPQAAVSVLPAPVSSLSQIPFVPLFSFL